MKAIICTRTFREVLHLRAELSAEALLLHQLGARHISVPQLRMRQSLSSPYIPP